MALLAGTTLPASAEPCKIGFVYPEAAKAAREQGTVIVELLVSSDYKLLDQRIKQSSGFADLDNAALDAFKKTFSACHPPSPPSSGPKDLVWVPMQFTWRLNDSPPGPAGAQSPE